MVLPYSTNSGILPQSSFGDLEAVLAAIDDTAIIACLQKYRHTGRPGYSLRALWRSYVASFVLNMPHTNALIRRLAADLELRTLCGFAGPLPHRTTFNRFIQRLSHHADLVEDCFVGVTGELKQLLPDLGETVALDSTVVYTHSNPNRKRISDPEASWTMKNSTSAKAGGKEWFFGHKFHMVADAKYGIPLAGMVTTAKAGDSPMLPTLIGRFDDLHPWFGPRVAVADKGYDSQTNHRFLLECDILPVIQIRKPTAKDKMRDDIYTADGVPTCMGNVPMEYVSSHPEFGHLYRCRDGGCHLADSNKGGVLHCDAEVWEDPMRNPRVSGPLRRGTQEWKDLYVMRQAIERIFKSLKESRRLNRHCVRGLRQITLHSFMSMLTFQATVLVRVQEGDMDWMRWMVRKVA